MTTATTQQPPSTTTTAGDTHLDLVLSRVVSATPRQLWKAWTTPELLKQWFAPKPWSISAVNIDVRPGGTCSFTMRSPEGQEFPNAGCFLEVIEHRKIVMTDALGPDFRPSAEPFFTAIITLVPEGEGTRYTARALHKNEADRQKHEQMGFHEGWGQCLDQLVAIARTL